MSDSLILSKQHIVIEGPIGVGKSSLSRKIVDTFGGHLFLEQPADNPFLERFYKDPQRFALQTQLFFLLQRVTQFTELNVDQTTERSRIVADFMLDKDLIFAQLNLNDEELSLYQQVFDNLSVNVVQPDLVVYLQAPVKVLQQRIKKRNIKYELKIDNAYLESLSNAYTEFFHRYCTAPLLIVNAAEFNPIDNDRHFAALINQIDKIQAGKHFFNPLSV